MQNSPVPIRFEAIIEKHPGMDAAFVTFPFSVQEVFGTKGQVKVKAFLEGYEYRGSLAPMGSGCHVLGIRKEIRNAIGKTFGDVIVVELEQDLEPRIIATPPDLQELLDQYPEAKAAFEKLSYTHRREHVQYLEEAKKPETRQRRLQKTLKLLNG